MPAINNEVGPYYSVCHLTTGWGYIFSNPPLLCDLVVKWIPSILVSLLCMQALCPITPSLSPLGCFVKKLWLVRWSGGSGKGSPFFSKKEAASAGILFPLRLSKKEGYKSMDWITSIGSRPHGGVGSYGVWISAYPLNLILDTSTGHYGVTLNSSHYQQCLSFHHTTHKSHLWVSCKSLWATWPLHLPRNPKSPGRGNVVALASFLHRFQLNTVIPRECFLLMLLPMRSLYKVLYIGPSPMFCFASLPHIQLLGTQPCTLPARGAPSSHSSHDSHRGCCHYCSSVRRCIAWAYYQTKSR